MNDGLKDCKHEGERGFSFLQSSRFSGEYGSGRDEAYLCLTCGKIRIVGDRDFKHFEVEIRISLPEQAEAVSRWVEYITGEETREERIESAIRKITDWRDKAYPLDIFPEPDSARAHELLQSGGMTLDAVSASMARHVLKRVCEILREEGLLHEQEDN